MTRKILLLPLIVAALLLPLLGLRLTEDQGLLTLTTHWPLLLATTLAVTVVILVWQKLPRITLPAMSVKISTRTAGMILALTALALPWLPFTDRYVLDITTLVFIYILLGLGLNITIGLTGLLDLGYVAFYALGAYATALLELQCGLSFYLALPIAMLIAAGASLIVGIPTLRLRGDYFAIATLGFAEILRLGLTNWQSLTGGPNGLSRIPRPGLGEIMVPAQRVLFLYYLALAFVLLVLLFVRWLRRQKLGRQLEALREDEIAASAVGIGVARAKLIAYAFSAMIGAVGGALFAAKQGFVSPESFTFAETALLLAIVVLGGAGSTLGIVIAAILLVGLPELFRELQDYRMLAFGAALVALMIWRPGGLFAVRRPQARLKP